MSTNFDVLFESSAKRKTSTSPAEKKTQNFDDLFEKARENKQPSRFKSLINAPFKGIIEGAQNLHPLMNFPISQEGGAKVLEELLPSQKKTPEKILKRAGELTPIVATGPEGIVAKGAQIAGGALAGYLAENEGLGAFGQTVAEIAGMMFPGMAKSLGMKAINTAKKGASKTAGEVFSASTQLKPEQIKQGVIEAAERLGVIEDLPLSAQVSNPKIQSIETKLIQSHAGAPLQEKLERAGEKLVGKYNEATESVSKRENMLPSVVSREASEVLQKLEENAEKSYRSLYSQAAKSLPEAATTSHKMGTALQKVLDSTIGKLKSSLGTSSKDAVLNRLNRLKTSWSASPELKSGLIPIKDLQEVMQDINQVIKYETKGGADKILHSLRAVAKEAVNSYGREFNRPYLNRFTQAQHEFGKVAKDFRKNALIKNLVKGNNPEQIFGKMNTVKGINELEKIFNKTGEGKEMMDVLKRYKLEDILNKKILDKNGDISWGKAAGIFKEPKIRDLVIKLVGPEQYKKLQDLSKVAGGVEEGFKKFANKSGTATTGFDLFLLVGMPIKAAAQIASKNWMGALKTTALFLSPKQIAKIMANPKFADAAIKTAKAGKGNSAERFINAAKDVAKITAEEMIEDNENHLSEIGKSQSSNP